MSFAQYIRDNSEDAVFFFALHRFEGIKEGQIRKIAEAIKDIMALLILIKDDVLRDQYIQEICNQSEIELQPDRFHTAEDKFKEEERKKLKAELEKKINQREEESGAVLSRIPEDCYDDYWAYRMFEREKGKETGYWFPQQEGNNYHRLTNFIVKPLFHLKSPEKNVRLVEAIGYDQQFDRQFSAILEMPSGDLLKKDLFATRLFDEGPFICESNFSNVHMSRIKNKISFQFRVANEIQALGWQREGNFWAFANKAWNGSLIDYDKYGIVAIGDKHFLSPSASDMDKEKQNSEYENDKMHSYQPAKISFKEWAAMIMKVYNDNGHALIAFAAMTIFMDIVKRYTEAPLWYPYGAKESGKSTLAKSLMALFYKHDFDPFNLGTASTDYAFFNRMERFNNCPAVFNEFDEFGIKDEWFRAFKAVYDGEGRERGRGIRGKTETQKIRCSVVIIGQYLSSKDDNSVLSRTIPCLVHGHNFTQEEVDRYNKLKELEHSGLTGIIIEILQHRDHFDKSFRVNFQQTFTTLKEAISKKGVVYSNRILKNYATLAATIATLSTKLQFPFNTDDFNNYCLKRVADISSSMSESNALADFWKTVAYLLDRNQIVDGYDFRIITEVEVTIQQGKAEKLRKPLETPQKVLYIRIANVFREYAKVVQSITKTKGLNEQTLMTYLKEQPYFIGHNGKMRFSKSDPQNGPVSIVTSSIMLMYDQIGIDIERNYDTDDSRADETFQCQVWNAPSKTSIDDRFMFTVVRNISKATESGLPKTETQYTKCFIHRTDKVETDLLKDNWIEIKGKTQINISNGKTYRTMDVESYTVIDRQIDFSAQITPPPPPTTEEKLNTDLF